MAWASKDIIPASVNITANYEYYLGTIENDVFLTIRASKSDGTAFDFSAASGAQFTMLPTQNNSNPLYDAGSNATHINATILSATSSLLKLQLAAADLLTAFQAMPQQPTLFGITASDGTTQLIVGSGIASLRLVP